MAVDMFMKIDSVKGESKDDKHKDEIDILAWSWGMSQSGSGSMGGGSSSGKVNVQDMSLTKYVDKASPVLMQNCCTGKAFKEALLVVRKAGGDGGQQEYMKIKMTDVLISNVSTGGSGGEDRLTENVSLNFKTVEVAYSPQKPDGSLDGEVKAGWNIEANKTL